MAKDDRERCPKCGSTKWRVHTLNSYDGKWYIVKCDGCPFKTVPSDDREDAIEDFLAGKVYDDPKPKNNDEDAETDDFSDSWRVRRR